jgi:DNA-binding PadR family transcriptional regulator
MSDYWDGPDDERHGRAAGGAARSRKRLDLRRALLRLIAEEPRTGAQLIEEMDRRSAGRWTPRPESVYAMLQMLQDEGLVTIVESAEGKRLHDLTEAGRAEADQLAGRAGPGGSDDGGEGSSRDDMMRAIADATRVFVAAAMSAEGDQKASLVAALRQFRESVLAAVPDAADRGAPPWGWIWGGGSGPGRGRRPGIPDLPDWLSSFGAGGWPPRGRGWQRSWPPFGPGPDDEDEDEMW